MDNEETKELIFALFASAIVVAALSMMGSFGMNASYALLLFAAAMFGLLAQKLSPGLRPEYVLLVSLAGLFTAFAFQAAPNISGLLSVAAGFAVSVALPSILFVARREFAGKK